LNVSPRRQQLHGQFREVSQVLIILLLAVVEPGVHVMLAVAVQAV
jgi:hypothetical protein